MKNILYQLAYRNVKKYKKHYTFVAIVIFVLSIVFMSVIMGYSNYYEVKKTYELDHYGTWYIYIENINDEEFPYFLDEAKNKKAHYGMWYDQGMSDEHTVGYLSNNLYEMCHLTLKEGRFPQKDNEIMISSELIDEYQLNQSIELTLEKTQSYRIVGIIENSQDIFPQIYTNIPQGDNPRLVLDTMLGIKDSYSEIYHFTYYLDTDIGEEIVVIYTPIYNEYGYDANEQMGMYNQISSQLFFFMEVLALTVIGLVVITMTSLKRRSKEFALLRGIGMTTRQLFIMIFFENFMTATMSVLVGVFLSFGVVYVVMLYFETIYHYFLYRVDIVTTCFYFLVLLFFILGSTMLPILSSSRHSLSGSFDSQKFQYIQVRYRKLKKQTNYQLAVREMKTYRRTSRFLVLLFGVLSVIYLFTCFKPYENVVNVNTERYFDAFHTLSYDVESQYVKEASQIKDTTLYRLKNAEENKLSIKGQDGFVPSEFYYFLSLDDKEDVLKNCIIEGEFPQSPHEILVSENARFTINTYISDNEVEGHSVLVSLGDVLLINDKEYTIVGVVKNNEIIERGTVDFKDIVRLDYLPYFDVAVLPEVFDHFQGESQYKLRKYFDDYHDKDKYVEELCQNSFIQEDNLFYSDDILNYDIPYQGFNLKLEIDPYLLILPVLMSLIFCYFLNKNDIMNHMQDYALLKLVGMTNKDLMKKQFFKAVRMTYLELIVIASCIIVIDMNVGYLSIPFKEIILMTIVIFIMSLIIYCLPLYQLLKEDVMSILYGNE